VQHQRIDGVGEVGYFPPAKGILGFGLCVDVLPAEPRPPLGQIGRRAKQGHLKFALGLATGFELGLEIAGQQALDRTLWTFDPVGLKPLHYPVALLRKCGNAEHAHLIAQTHPGRHGSLAAFNPRIPRLVQGVVHPAGQVGPGYGEPAAFGHIERAGQR
jgi:hypothetical protein